MVSFLLTLKRLFHGLFHSFREKEFQVIFVLIILMLISGTIFYTKVEGLSVIDSLYFCFLTLSTIGHPSFEPQTNFGKIFTMIYILAGIGLFIGLIARIGRGIINSKAN
ncbi:potassium channel family protein [Heyndrickxia sporothermodurans]